MWRRIILLIFSFHVSISIQSPVTIITSDEHNYKHNEVTKFQPDKKILNNSKKMMLLTLEQKKSCIQNLERAYHNAIWHECMLTIASLTGIGITFLPVICKSSLFKKYKNLLYTGQSIIFLLSLWGMALRPAAHKDSIFWGKQLTEKVNEYARIAQRHSFSLSLKDRQC